jgi:hypothetical protein
MVTAEIFIVLGSVHVVVVLYVCIHMVRREPKG